MNFQQLRSVREAVRCGFNLTEVAHALHTSQPGVSRQIRELEEELGIELFVRAGKRLTGLTEPGGHVLPIIERMLHGEQTTCGRRGRNSWRRQSGRSRWPPRIRRRAMRCRWRYRSSAATFPT